MITEFFSTFRTRQEQLGGLARVWNLHLHGATILFLVMPSAVPEIDSPTPSFLGRSSAGRATA